MEGRADGHGRRTVPEGGAVTRMAGKIDDEARRREPSLERQPAQRALEQHRGVDVLGTNQRGAARAFDDLYRHGDGGKRRSTTGTTKNTRKRWNLGFTNKHTNPWSKVPQK